MAYKIKVKKISVTNESGDRVVIISCYLIDSFGVAFKAVDGSLGFDIRVPKSSLPDPYPDPDTYLTGLAKDQIAKKYNRYLTATSTPTHGDNKILFLASDVEKLFTGLTVTGAGIETPTTLTSITTPTEIQLSSNINLQVIGSTTSPSFTYTGDTTSDSNIITNISSTVNMVEGMLVVGTNVPFGSTVLSIGTTSITITQRATGSTTGVSLTFSTDANSAYLNTTTSYFTSTVYEGLTITGASIARNTTISEVITSSKIKLSNNATGTSASQTYSISGKPIYYFDAANLSLDDSELLAISGLPIINFSNL